MADAASASAVHALAGGDPSLSVCVVAQLSAASGSCADAALPGWCYLSGQSAPGGCSQAVVFSPTGNPTVGAAVYLACP